MNHAEPDHFGAKDTVLLISPFWGADVTKALHSRMESLSLGYLAASSRQHAIKVDLVDSQLFCLSEEETVERALVKPYALIGISISAQRIYQTAVRLIKRLRAAGIQSHIVVGGLFATFAHDRILQEVREIDSVLRGDADYSLVELAKCIIARQPLEGVKGLTFRGRAGGSVENAGWALPPTGGPGEFDLVSNADADPVRDLDVLPLAARDYLPTIINEVLAGERAIGMLAGRGCDAKCSFCTVPPYVGKLGRRFRSPAKVVAEMESLNREWGVKYFRFYDDTLIGRGGKYATWSEEFSELLIDRLPGIEFEAMGIRADGASPELFRKLRAAGLREVFVGLDTGSKSRLKNYRKPQTLPSSLKTVELLKNLGMKMNYGFIMFQPTSTLGEVRDNYQFLQAVKDYNVHNLVNRFNIFYGVPLEERLTSQGLVRKPEELSSRRHYDFADPGIRELLALLDVVGEEISQVQVIGANLELLLIELRIMLYEQNAQGRECDSRVVEARGKLEPQAKELTEKENAIWTRLFDEALVLAETKTDSGIALKKIKASAARERITLAREIQSIEVLVSGLLESQLVEKIKVRAEQICLLSHAFESSGADPAPASESSTAAGV